MGFIQQEGGQVQYNKNRVTTHHSDGHFSELLIEIDQLAVQNNPQDLQMVEDSLRDADKILTKELQGDSYRTHAATFELDFDGIIRQLSPLAVTQLHLKPNQLFPMPSQQAKDVFNKMMTGKIKGGLITMPVKPFGKPILMSLRYKNNKRISATVLSMAWLSIVEAALQDQFGLSEAEADIARLIFEGAAPKVVATVRQSSIETVRKQIRSLLNKTGARSLTDLLHILYSVVGETDRRGMAGLLFPERTMIELENDTVYDVITSGPRTGQPLLFIHGALGGRRLHPKVLNKLSDRFIIAPGRPFHGQSRAPNIERTSQAFVIKDLAKICDYYNIKNMDLLAYNSGVSYALTLAQIIPDRIGRIVLVSPTPSIVKVGDIMRMRSQERVFLLTARTSQITATYLARAGGKKLVNDGPSGFAKTVFSGLPADVNACEKNAELRDLYWQGHSWHTEQGPDGFVSDIINANSNWQADIHSLAMNITYIVGDGDKTVPQAPFQALVSKTGGKVRIIENAGLSLFHANPDAWLESL